MNLLDIPFHSKINVLFENERFFVIDKPNGILSHPNEKLDKMETAVIHAPYDFQGEFFRIGQWKAFLLHRIDKETSGCLMFAKDAASAKKVKADFETHQVHKEYTALLSTVIKKPITWKDHLIKRGNKMLVDKRQKPNAITHVQPLMNFPKYKMSLVKFKPKTGKTHQLRAQSFDHHGAIVGDRQYGNFARNKEVKHRWDFDRMFLHADTIEFKDPVGGKKIRVESPLPEELQDLINSLKAST